MMTEPTNFWMPLAWSWKLLAVGRHPKTTTMRTRKSSSVHRTLLQ
jgi:hypothetical protein